jgi:fatty acid desaturase
MAQFSTDQGRAAVVGHRRASIACTASSQAPSPAPFPSTTSTGAYSRELRSLLPPEAFRADRSRLTLVLINLAILTLGWLMAAHLHQWPLMALPLFLPFALVMANAVVVLLFASHDLLHGSAIRGQRTRRWLGFLGLAVLWMPPTLWQAVHNRQHHGHTNSLADPDRSYLESQPATWGKRIQHAFVPSDEVTPWGLALGMGMAWWVHNLRSLLSVLIGPHLHAATKIVPAAFSVSRRERKAILLEVLLLISAHASVIALLGLRPLPLLLGYGLPLGLGTAVAMAYIYTNHMLCPLEDENDPLANSVSLRLPAFVDLLHLNFSHHAEHHIFPGMNADYYPLLRQILLERYPERYQLLSGREAWRRLMSTPRHYRDGQTLVNWSGDRAVALAQPPLRPPGCGSV